MRLLLFVCFWLFAIGQLCATVIYVPGDSGTIQSGVNGAAPGDTVHIGVGTFTENVTIDKPIALIGTGAPATTIDGSETGDVVRITSDHVTVSRLSITKSGSVREYDGEWDAGVKIVAGDSCRIEYCRLHDNGAAGFALTFSRDNIISHCAITGNYCGIYFYEDWEITPSVDNTGNVIRCNHIVDNSPFGIGFGHTGATYHQETTVCGNYIVANGCGMHMIMSHRNQISYNHFGFNTNEAIFLSMCMGGGDQNEIHHNCFWENNGGSTQAFQMAPGATNYWYSVAQQEGNYWSDYNGNDIDLDGIGDTPYIIGGDDDNDEYPMMIWLYLYRDNDMDGVIDSVDNCPFIPNRDQTDENVNGYGDVCEPYVCGDANGDETINVGDAVYLVAYIFTGGPPPAPLEAGDANCDFRMNIGDGVYLINYIFKEGPQPCCP